MKVGTDNPTYGSVGQRLKAIRARLGKSQEEMALAAGIPLDTYKKYEGDSRTPGGDALAGLGLMGIDLTWLLTNQGGDEMGSASHRVKELRPGYVYLPLYDVRAAAGHGKFVESEQLVDVLAFKEDWIRQELRARPDDLRLIYVEGDSMEPDLRAGDIVLLDHTDTLASREGVYVLRMDGALLVKSLQRLPGGIVKVNSRNPSYEAFTVKIADIEEPNGFAIIGRVVWTCRRY